MSSLQYTLTSHKLSEQTSPPCVVNRKNATSCGFVGGDETGENLSNSKKRNKFRDEYCEYIVSRTDQGNKHSFSQLQHDTPLSSDVVYPTKTLSMSAGTN